MPRIRCGWIAALILVLVSEHRTTAEDAVRFSRDVQPIFAKRCYACHGPDASEGGLALHEREGVLGELDSGEHAVVPGDLDQSELIRRVTSADEWQRMPPEGESLNSAEIETLRAWVLSGAKYDKHWAFVPVGDVQPPEVKDSSWVRNPIDRFILARLESRGLRPAAPADRRTLLRRVCYDLTGLPPTTEQRVAFLKDPRPDAYERLVERLLGSEHYGEKWARHWLDVVRYAESNSFERDETKPYAWKYRDYVIRSLNDDKPYDQFVREQLAGDELESIDDQSITATGYYRLGAWDDEPADPLQSKYDDLDNIISTTSQAFLGLTIGCARCHDHKIDPISQVDYYGFLAFFADVTPYALPKNRSAHVHSLWDLSPSDVKQSRDRLNGIKARTEAELREIEQLAIGRMEGEDQRTAETPERAQLLDKKLADYQTEEERTRYAGVQREFKATQAKLDALPPPNWVLALMKCEPEPETTHVMLRGNAHALGDPVDPRYPGLFGAEAPILVQASDDARSAGRRRVLADWIADPENMLTSRVIANRVWAHHLGRGIVRSANNFGRLGTPPTHPELLDWLANYLVAHEWRLKALHRLILTSNTYRMSSRADPEGLATDPANDLFWRFEMRRLSAEEIRDSVLQVSGELNTQVYGPSVYPKLSDEVLATQSRPGHGWETSPERLASRRSIYIHIKRSVIPPVLEVFDYPDTDSSCEARFNTIQAAQALNLMHSEFLQEQAGRLAERIQREVDGSLEDRVAFALELCLQREADDATIHDGLGLIERLIRGHGASEGEAFRQFCLMVLNLNEFIYVD